MAWGRDKTCRSPSRSPSIGAATALVVSFVALGFLWREPRLGAAGAGVALSRRIAAVLDSPATRVALRVLGLALTAYVAVAAIGGPDLATNPTAGSVYVLFWVGLAFASVLLGPLWRLLNPLRTVHLLLAKALRTDPDRGLGRYPERLGQWPAAVSVFSFVWLELIAPDRATLPVLRMYFAFYAAAHVLGSAWFGRRWFAQADGFEVWSSLLGRLSVLGRRESDRRLALRTPLDNLAALRPQPGRAAIIVVMLGSTAFDGLANAPVWFRFQQRSSLPGTVTGTLGLLGMIALVGAAYALAVAATGWLGARGNMAVEFSHTLVPIAVGYLVAHYYSLLVLEGQRTLTYLSDPLVNGADLFGTAQRPVSDAWIPATAVSVIQVVAVVTGHVLGVVLAHDRAVALLPRRRAVVGQLPLLVLMIGYTVGGLSLLFAV